MQWQAHDFRLKRWTIIGSFFGGQTEVFSCRILRWVHDFIGFLEVDIEFFI